MRDINNADAEIEEKTNRINEIELQIKQLNAEKKELQKIVDSFMKENATIDILQSIYSLTPENSKRVYLQHNTKTTPIIDDFYFSDKDFLVFENAFFFSGSWQEVSLVVAKITGEVNYADSKLTMTVLKQNVHEMISEHVFFYNDDEGRMESLGIELSEIYKKSPTKKGLVPFNVPCLLGGQSYYNQTDLGREQHGEYVIKDKRYGETTKFLIIGVELN